MALVFGRKGFMGDVCSVMQAVKLVSDGNGKMGRMVGVNLQSFSDECIFIAFVFFSFLGG